ncbi:MAG: sodium:proton antiporter [Phycisphaeraceae bacterium]|nr:sodium:proton antiporter [Phycisphaeraceae bacterium]
MTNSNAAQSIALALGVSAIVSVFCRRMRIPALLPLLVTGVALGTSGLELVDGASLGGALTGFITVAIGLLIFEGALHLNREELARAPRAVWGLLTIGAAITWAGASAAAHFFLGMSTPIAVLLGASLIVTGPTVVQPILRLMKVSPRLHAVLGAEAVLVDPIGVVVTIAVLDVLRLYFLHGFLQGSESKLASEGMWVFFRPLVGGAGIGIIMGLVGRGFMAIIGRSAKPEPQLVNLTAVGVCMTCVGIGEAITPEGGLAAVTICGIMMARARILGATELRAFKELLAVMLVGTLFVLLASRFDVSRLASLTWKEGAFVLALLFLVRPIAAFASTWGSKLDMRERVFAATFAPRGIVALSVIAVASDELGRAIQAGGSGLDPSVLSQTLGDIKQLDLVMFVTIAGTVLLASVFSPALAWALGLRAGEGGTVMLVGAHPMSVALAKQLASNQIPVRIVDSSEESIDIAATEGVEGIIGDATDFRWLDDFGSPHDVGWVIAWTGNHDVDQMAARWAEDRLGKGHTAIWSAKRARGALEAVDISAGEPLAEAVAKFEREKRTCATAKEAGALLRVIGWIINARFTLNVPTSKALRAPESALFVGISDKNGEGAVLVPDESREHARSEPPSK